MATVLGAGFVGLCGRTAVAVAEQGRPGDKAGVRVAAGVSPRAGGRTDGGPEGRVGERAQVRVC